MDESGRPNEDSTSYSRYFTKSNTHTTRRPGPDGDGGERHTPHTPALNNPQQRVPVWSTPNPPTSAPRSHPGCSTQGVTMVTPVGHPSYAGGENKGTPAVQMTRDIETPASHQSRVNRGPKSAKLDHAQQNVVRPRAPQTSTTVTRRQPAHVSGFDRNTSTGCSSSGACNYPPGQQGTTSTLSQPGPSREAFRDSSSVQLAGREGMSVPSNTSKQPSSSTSGGLVDSGIVNTRPGLSATTSVRRAAGLAVVGDQSSSDISAEDIQTTRQAAILDSSSDETNQVYLSLFWNGGVLGCSYYDAETSCLHLMRETPEYTDFRLLRSVIEQTQPAHVLVSAKQDEKFMTTLTAIARGVNSDTDVSSASNESTSFQDDTYPTLFKIQVLPNIMFTLQSCKRRLISIETPSIPEHYTDEERAIHMSSLINFSDSNTVRAAGALVKFLDKIRLGVELEGPDVQVSILAVQTRTLALQIFQRESHPSVYKSYSTGKEGLSLFGVMNRTKSAMGSKLMRKWFRQPLRDKAELNKRLDVISYLSNPRNVDVVATLQDSLKHMKNVPRILTRMRTSAALITDWMSLYKTVYHAVAIGELCRQQPQRLDIFSKISKSFTGDMTHIGSLISKIIDFDESMSQGRFIVKQGVDANIDELKRTFNGLPDFLTQVADQELNRLDDSIAECSIIYLPQLGYLLTVSRASLPDDNYNVDGLTFMFASNDIVHYKSPGCLELDQHLGDTLCEIQDSEIKIMHQLQNTILEYCNILFDVNEYVAELDCLLSLAVCAKEYNFVRPEFVEDNHINIVGGRHALQELCVSQFVPNNTSLGVNSGRVSVLTGPNSSGKSVYLKQVGLIIYLAHIGSFVPAESASLVLIDALYTRIHTCQSVSVGLSSFMVDLNQIATAVCGSSRKSLILVDEFGKGTATVDGVSLLAATLRHWLSDVPRCPFVIVSTHFHSIVNRNLLSNSPLIKYETMKTLQEGDELVFLYQLIEGVANHSYASHIAAKAGLPTDIVKRGSELTELIRMNEPVNRVGTANVTQLYRVSQQIVDQFMKFDLENGDVQGFLKNTVLPISRLMYETDTGS